MKETTANLWSRTSIAGLMLVLYMVGLAQAQAGSWWDPDWDYRKKITIPASSPPTTIDLSDFPVLISLDDAELTKARADGWDLVFTDDAGVQLDHEIEHFAQSSGALRAWVRIPVLTWDTDTAVYLYYGNAGVLTTHENPASVWDVTYKLVHHLEESAPPHLDSTLNTNDGAVSGSVSQGLTGQINGGVEFDGSTGKITVSHSTSLAITDVVTFEAWINPDALPTTPYWNLLVKGSGFPYQFYLEANTGRLNFYSDFSGVVTSGTPVTAGVWQHVAISVHDDLDEVKFYINGSQVGTTQLGNLDTDDGSDVQIGAFNANNYFDGMMDEIRLSRAVRSADWIASSYANQNDPTSFYSVGLEETFGGEPVVSNPLPSDGAADVSVSLSELRFTLTDNEGDLMDYSVWTSPDIGSDGATGVSDGEYVLAVSGLAYDTTYTWYVDASDPAGSGGTTNAVFTFSTETAPGGWWNHDWHYRKSITIDHTQVAEELIDFPLLVSLTDSDLGAQAQANGDDIVFTDYLGVQLDHELEYYSAGDLVAWVRIPLLPADVDTPLFMYYGNVSAPNQENATGVWGAAYDMVHHLSETSGTHFDSTINARDGEPFGGPNQNDAGLTDGADAFQTPEQYVEGSSFPVGNVYTYSLWFNANTLAYPDPRGDWNCLFELAANNTNRIILWTLKDADPATTAELYVSHKVPVVTTNAAIEAGQWYYAVFTFDFDASPQARMYVDGQPVGLTQDTGLPATPVVSPGIFRIGTDTFQSPDFTLDGRIDEVRFAERVHSPGWVLTEYNNQWSPSTFYDVGSEENNLAVCGNSIVDFGEDCDDGNTADGDCCSSLCLYELLGSPCGDQTDAPCDHPDTCDGAGACLDNLEPDATPCEDGQFCTVGQICLSGSCQGGTDPCTNPELPHCDEQSDQCVECLINEHCEDGVFCDGAEQCVNGTCETDGDPCDDGVACTDDSCNEATNTCTNAANDANCDDGLFCNGPETCNALSGCQTGAEPCTEPTPVCDEVNDVCLAECFTNDDCDDGNVCTWGTCQGGECAYSIRPYGDVDRNVTLNLFDVFCLLDLIGGETPDDPNCVRSTADIEPCAGNGVVSILDIFAVLAAIGGDDPCCSGVSLGRDRAQSGNDGSSISNVNETSSGVHR